MMMMMMMMMMRMRMRMRMRIDGQSLQELSARIKKMDDERTQYETMQVRGE